MPDAAPVLPIPGRLPQPDRAGATDVGPFRVRWSAFGPADGPPIVLLHGIYAGAHGVEWRLLVPELDRSRPVWVPDLLGAGLSDRPDLQYTPDVVLAGVRAILEAAGPDATVVASSLTGAYAVRAVASGTPTGRLILVTPTGLGGAQTSPQGPIGAASYAVLRHTPLGDLAIHLLSSPTSVRWFQRNKTYADPGALDEAEVVETRRAARRPNAKQLQLAFVTGALALPLTEEEVRSVAPLVVWAHGQSFAADADRDRWAAAGAAVIDLSTGLPQIEEPAHLASICGLSG